MAKRVASDNHAVREVVAVAGKFALSISHFEAWDFTVENGFEVGFCWRADLVPCVTGELRVDGVGVLPPVIGNGVKAAFFQESFAVSGECLEGVV